MPRNLKKELVTAPSVSELSFGWRAKRKPAQHERTSVASEILLAALSLSADEGDGFQLTKPELCDGER
jgi:hypothetical protein